MIYVLDASAMIAYMRKEVGWDLVANLLADINNLCYAHAVNLCELFYDYYRAGGEVEAQAAVARILAAGVLPRTDMEPAFWQEAGRIKAVHRRVSLADCFGIVLTQRVNGELVTSDHRELDPLVPLGLCPIRFIR